MYIQSFEDLRRVPEVGLLQPRAPSVSREPLSCRVDRVGIQVEADHLGGLTPSLEDLHCVSSAPRGAVEKRPAALGTEVLEHLPDHDRLVLVAHALLSGRSRRARAFLRRRSIR